MHLSAGRDAAERESKVERNDNILDLAKPKSGPLCSKTD